MEKKHWIIGILAGWVALLGLYFIFDVGKVEQGTPLLDRKITTLDPKGVEPVKKRVKEVFATEEFGEPDEPTPNAAAPVGKEPEKADAAAVLSQEAKKSFANVAKAFEVSMKFPQYSRPLGKENWDLLHPHEFVAHKRAIDPDFKFSFQLDLPNFVLFWGDPIPVTFTLTADADKPLPAVQSLTGEIADGKNNVLKEFKLEEIENTNTRKVYKANLKPEKSDYENWPRELTVRVWVKLSGMEKAGHHSTFRYVAKGAVIKGRGIEYVLVDHLVIPIKLEVFREGRYRVRANLFDEKSGEPISHVTGKNKLSVGDGEVEMKVHAVALFHKNAPGPYILKDFSVTRVPAPGKMLEYGSSDVESFNIPAHSLNLYTQREYEDDLNKERLEFLQKLSKPKGP